METVEKTPEQVKADDLKNQLGVIGVIERLFSAVNAGSFPLKVHDDVMGGMNFLAQFHKQLVGKLPPGVLESLQKSNAPEPAPAVAAPEPAEVPNEPARV